MVIDRERLWRRFAERPARRSTFMTKAAAAVASCFDKDGEWIADAPSPEHVLLHAGRERLWSGLALYGGNERQRHLADQIIRRTNVTRYEDGHRFDIFTSNFAPLLYLKHSDRMAEDVKAFLLELTEEGHHNFPGDRQCNYQFSGTNDNMPARATMGLILGGELLGREDRVEHGMWLLRQLQNLLTRNGLISECTSPTYSGGTLFIVANIVELSRNEEVRALARAIERRLWVDVACHWHPQARQLAGPHSRAYTNDAIGHLTHIHQILWALFGEEASGLSPLQLFDVPKWMHAHNQCGVFGSIVSACRFISTEYHIDRDLAELMVDKPDPFDFQATAEIASSVEPHKAICKTHIRKDFSVGSADSPLFGEGVQNDPLYVTCAHDEDVPVGSTMYVKYTINDENPKSTPEEQKQHTGETHNLRNHAYHLTVQQGPSALLASHPYHRRLAGQEFIRMGNMVIFALHLHEVEKLVVGDEERDEWEGMLPPRRWVGVTRGRCHLGFRPLVYSPAGFEPHARLERYGRFKVIALDNYRGAPRVFRKSELTALLNGFVMEAAGVTEYDSLHSFVAGLSASTRFEDYFFNGNRTMRYLRAGMPARDDLELALSYSSEGISRRYATVNGREVLPVPWQATGLPPEKLPFLTEPHTPMPPGLPWDSLVRHGRNTPHAIHESGQASP